MKKYTHAWLALKAVEILENKKTSFDDETNKYLKRFLSFINRFPSAFVRGAWFPDTVIKDNVQSGHTWKYKFDDNGELNKYKPPKSVTCLSVITDDDLNKKITLVERYSDLPDRCEALSQSLRDMIKITNSLKSGDMILFNDAQVATFFLMLSHYIADAHMPLHCDVRDFYTPSTIHPDMEDLWEKEIIKYYNVSKQREQFDLDEKGNLQRNAKKGFDISFLHEVDEIINRTEWYSSGSKWDKFLGKENNNIWDYLVGVCHVSFLVSHYLLPESELNGNYNIKIKHEERYLSRITDLSPNILADAIISIAIVWFSTWMRWELLEKGMK